MVKSGKLSMLVRVWLSPKCRGVYVTAAKRQRIHASLALPPLFCCSTLRYVPQKLGRRFVPQPSAYPSSLHSDSCTVGSGDTTAQITDHGQWPEELRPRADLPPRGLAVFVTCSHSGQLVRPSPLRYLAFTTTGARHASSPKSGQLA